MQNKKELPDVEKKVEKCLGGIYQTRNIAFEFALVTNGYTIRHILNGQIIHNHLSLHL